MKLLELFITETTEEDRAILSLSSTIYNHIQKYTDYVDPKDTSPLDVGRIDDFCSTPLEDLSVIDIQLLHGPTLRAKVKNDSGEKEDDVEVDHSGKVILGAWYPNIATIYINADYITSNAIKSTIAHELRHALDDLKSSGQASKDNGKYRTPKKKEHRKKDPYADENYPYIAQPAEINARFIQVLHAVTNQISRGSHLPSDQLWTRAMTSLKHSMQVNKISKLFPEKEASPEYKRLIKRAADYIQKEIAYQKSIE